MRPKILYYLLTIASMHRWRAGEAGLLLGASVGSRVAATG